VFAHYTACVRFPTQERGEAHLRHGTRVFKRNLQCPNRRSALMQHQACNQPVVLVVEDETLLRWSAVSAAQDAGFCAVEAGSAIEAIAILENRNDIRIVFTDIQMPGSMDGLRLAHLISTPLAAYQNSRHIRPAKTSRRRSSGRRAISAQALCRLRSCGDAARFDRCIGL